MFELSYLYMRIMVQSSALFISNDRIVKPQHATSPPRHQCDFVCVICAVDLQDLVMIDWIPNIEMSDGYVFGASRSTRNLVLSPTLGAEEDDDRVTSKV